MANLFGSKSDQMRSDSHIPAGHRPSGFFKRLVVWLRRPFRYKLYSMTVRIFRIANNIDSEMVRTADFDARDPAQEFSIATYGPEKFVVLNFDKAISRILFSFFFKGDPSGNVCAEEFIKIHSDIIA